jgi:hypothetical protein
VVALLACAAGCAAESSDGGNSGPIYNTGGLTGSGGIAGTGATAAGTGATAAGTGGIVAGTGGIVAGTGGTVTATGGTSGGNLPTPPALNTTGKDLAGLTAGYFDATPWKGYAYTYSNSAALTQVTPADLSAGNVACVAGGSAASYEAGGGLGINLNQGIEGGAGSEMTWTTTGSGFNVTLDNQGGGEVRVQVEAGGVQYCKTLAAGAQTVAWSDLTKNCWEAGGEALPAGSAIKAIQFGAPGKGDATSTFAFCVTAISPAS